MVKDTWFERIWRIMAPEIVYVGICYLVDFVAAAVWGTVFMGDYISGEALDVEGLANAMTDMMIRYGLLLQCAGALIAIFFLGRMYLKDYPKRRFIFNKKSVQSISWIWIIPAGVFGSLAGNMFMNMTDLASLSENFKTSEEILFSGPVWIQMIGIGVIIPICEELIYRGLIYMRMRQYMNVNLAVGASALIFAIMHGNIVQGIYAFILGVLFAYIYEKYGSVKAAVLVHVSANLASVSLNAAQFEVSGTGMMFVIGIVSLAICAGAVWMIDRKVSAERIYLEQKI